jgi:formamidopyrimidine-DNA glycosylase
VGQCIEHVELRATQLRWPLPANLPAILRRQTVQQVMRRGKYLLLECEAGWVIVHLGMSGTLRVFARTHSAAPDSDRLLAGKHDHVDWVFERSILRLRDPRRFGAVLWHPRTEADIYRHPLLAKLGIEPFSPEFTGDLLYERTRSREVSIKQILLAGDIVTGVGNIYATESLFRAGIRPTLAARRITLARYRKLAEQIRTTLGEAIEKGGSTLRDFVGGDGKSGYFQLNYFAYGRTDLPCRVCGAPIRRVVQGQRSTFYCPACQH